MIGKPEISPLINTDDTDQKESEKQKKHLPRNNADDADQKKPKAKSQEPKALL